MPYCPKCDMEFIEGITVCSDCGGPLYESEEAYKAIEKEETAKRLAEQAAQMEAFQALMEAESDEDSILDDQEDHTQKPEDAQEKEKTQSIIQWFTDTYTAEALDNAIGADASSLSSEELSLKRYELIQDYLITNHDLPDQTYVDALSEEIYGKLYE